MSDLVRKLTDDQLNFQSDVFNAIFNKPELSDVSIAIFSISGPTRSGKSYLLNVFYQLIDQQVHKDENGQAVLPKVFKSTRQVNPETDGIYMTTTPLYTLDKKVAVFLMDTQGIEAGDKVQQKEADLFAISSALSFMHIWNVKQDIGWHHFDNLASERLVVVVRDWENPHQYEDGYKGGKKYLEKLKQKPDLKRQVLCLDRVYSTFDCFLMPPPGNKVARSSNKQIDAINEETWQEMKNLKQILFSDDKMQQAYEKAPKGEEIKDLTTRLTQAKENNKIDAPVASFEIFFDFEMKEKVESCFLKYKQNFDVDKETTLDLRHNNAVEEANKLLSEDSLGNINKYLKILQDKMNAEFEVITGLQKVEVVLSQWTNDIKQGKIRKKLSPKRKIAKSYIEKGKQFREKLTKELKNEHSRKSVLDELKKRLAMLYTKERTKLIENESIAACFGAAAIGVAGGDSLTALPVFAAFAAFVAFSSDITFAHGSAQVEADINTNHDPDDYNETDTVSDDKNDSTEEEEIYELKGEIRPEDKKLFFD